MSGLQVADVDADVAVERRRPFLQARGERYPARAEILSDTEKDAVWDEIRGALPQLAVYEKRTDRNIRVFRLERRDRP